MSVGWAWGQRQVTNHLRLTPARYPCPRGQICPHLQQEVPQGHKGGSVLWFVSPALNHDIVDVLGAVLGPGQTLPLLVNLMQDLVVGRCSLRTSRAPGSSPLISPPQPTEQLELLAAMPVPQRRALPAPWASDPYP